MPKRVQDIIPSTHRSIRDIDVTDVKPKKISRAEKKAISTIEKSAISIDSVKTSSSRSKIDSINNKSGSHSKPTEFIEEKIVEDKAEHVEITRLHVTPPPAKPKSKKWLWILLGLLSLFIIFYIAISLSTHFSKATFSISIKSVPVTVTNTTLVIPFNVSTSTNLTYKLINVSGSQSVVVPAIQGPMVVTSAQGNITLYNTYGTSSQRLVAGTRLSDDTGRIYRIKSTVTLPGYKKTSTSIVPGTVNAVIVADKPGDSYNISRNSSISDFHIVAFKPIVAKYSGMFARLTSDVSGGYSGVKMTVDPSVLSNNVLTMQNKVKDNLVQQLNSLVPNGYILYPNNIIESYTNPISTPNSSSTTQLSINGTIYAILLKKIDLANALAGATSTDVFDGSIYDTPGMENLQFVISNKKDFSVQNKSPIVAKISGSFSLKGIVPIETLKQALAGKKLEATVSVLKKYSSVLNLAQSSGEVTPPWVSTVPNDVSRITIKIK